MIRKEPNLGSEARRGVSDQGSKLNERRRGGFGARQSQGTARRDTSKRPVSKRPDAGQTRFVGRKDEPPNIRKSTREGGVRAANSGTKGRAEEASYIKAAAAGARRAGGLREVALSLGLKDE